MDEKDYIQQASELMSRGLLDSANTILKDAVSKFPNVGQLHFLAGALQAQLQDYQTAILHYEKALVCDPDLHIAQFQLGLLLATLGQNTQSIGVLSSLVLEESHYLKLFAQAIILTIENNIEPAMALIQRGLLNNAENASLNQDMRAMLERLSEAQISSSNNDETKETQKSKDATIELEIDNLHLLDIYKSGH